VQAAFQDRLLDALMPLKVKIKEAPAIVTDVAPATGLKVAPRLPTVETTTAAVVEASAPNGDTLDWCGTCDVCLDLLPCEATRQTLYLCCCKKVCKDCNVKCRQHDERCPHCRARAATSETEQMCRLQKQVDKGDAEAQLHLGSAYREGKYGLKKNTKRMFHLYNLAAAARLALHARRVLCNRPRRAAGQPRGAALI